MISISILIGNENFVKGRHKISDKKMEISKKDPALTPAKTDNLKTENLKTGHLKTGHLKEDLFSRRFTIQNCFLFENIIFL